MADRPYTLLSCGMSLDAYLDGPGEDRVLFSNDADFDRVDAVRADSDAILVGAATVRKDDPRLLVRDPARRARRVARGQCPSPAKVTRSSTAPPGPSTTPGSGWAGSPPSSTAVRGSTYARSARTSTHVACAG